MDPARFGIYTTLGCIPWTAALAFAGYAVGANWHSIVDGFKGPTYIIAAAVLILLAVGAWRYVRARPPAPPRAPEQPAAAQDNPPPGAREHRK